MTTKTKLFGANLVIVGTVLFLMFGPMRLQPERLIDVYIVVAALTVGATVNVLIVKVALRPIESLERLTQWVSEGRLAQRVPPSIVADPQMTRLSNTINEMLESLATGREEMEQLRAEVIYAAERERFNVAQELHDSVGQRLADASFQIAEAANAARNVATASRLGQAQKLLRAAINEIRGISRTAHPHVLTNPGSPGAFDELNEKSRRGTIPGVRPSASIASLLVPDRYSDLSRRDIRDVGLGIHRTRQR